MSDNKNPDTLVDLIKSLKAEGVPKEQFKMHVDRYLANKARDFGIPFSGSLELTPSCNLDCRMCYVHLEPSLMKGRSLLPLETWKSLISEAKDSGMRSLTFTGGECLTYPGFDELYLYAHALGLDMNILTNGLLLDEKRVEFFEKHPPVKLQVSLYGSCDDAYEKVTGHRVFDTVWKNILLAKQAQLPLIIAITPSSFMEGDEQALLQLVQDEGLSYNINNFLIEPGEETGRSGATHDASVKCYCTFYRKDMEFRGQEITPVPFDSLPEENRSGPPRTRISCGAGRSGFHINWQGLMYPCIGFDVCSGEPLAEGFAPAWKKINDYVNSMAVPCECAGCAYEKTCFLCVLEHMKDGSAAHCNPAVCQKTKLYLAEGVRKLPDPDC